MGQRFRKRRGPAPLITGLIALLLIGGAVLLVLGLRSGSASDTPGVVPEAAAPSGSDPAWPVGITVTRNATTVLKSGPEPWLALGLVDSDKATKTQPEGSIQIPPVTKPALLGWYCPGRAAVDPMRSNPRNGLNCEAPVPGNPGPAVVLGHVNGGGKDGVFADLGKVKPGDSIKVTRSDGRSVYFSVTKATGAAGVPKEKFPTASVYGPTNGAELRLITCGGRLDPKGHRYLDQIIVWATLDHARTAS